MASPAELDTIENTRLWVLGDKTDATKDDLLNLLRTTVTGQFQDYTHRQICKRTAFVERLNGKNEPWLRLGDAPIIDVTLLEIVDPAGPTVLQTLVKGTDFVIDDQSKEFIMLRHATDRRGVSGRFTPRFVAGENNVRVTYDSGYDPIPAGIRQAFLDSIKQAFDLRGNSAGLKSQKLGDYAETYVDQSSSGSDSGSGDQLSKSAKSALASYIRPWISTMRRDLTPDTFVRGASQLLQ